MLQIPRAFDIGRPCLLAVASSGSRGIYGALPAAGEWGLRKGCAVVHTDKGAGVGFFELQRRTAIRIDGVITTDLADPNVNFAPIGGSATGIAMRHAHSGPNPEAEWGQYLIEATAIAFRWLNAEFETRLPEPLRPANTLVIAAGISNGGGAVLRALECDRAEPRTRWFDGAVAIEPNVALRAPGVRPLYDIATLAALLQPCALLAEPDPDAPAQLALAAGRPAFEAWCADLATAADVQGSTTKQRASDARRRLVATGFGADALRLAALNVQTQIWTAVTATYASAYSRAGVADMPCDLGFASLDAAGVPQIAPLEDIARWFADANGIAPTANVGLVRRVGGTISAAAAQLPETARCLRRLYDDPHATGHQRLLQGLREIEMSGDPGDRPVIFVHGRADGLVLVGHNSRALYTAVQQRRGSRKQFRYLELEHAQHFDAFLALPGMLGRYVPTQPWLLAALDRVSARLTVGAALPPSQVLRARSAEAPSEFPDAPADRDRIRFARCLARCLARSWKQAARPTASRAGSSAGSAPSTRWPQWCSPVRC